MYIVFDINHFNGDSNDYNHREISQLIEAVEALAMDYNLSALNITFTKDDNIRVEFENPRDYTVWSLAWSRYVKQIVYRPPGRIMYDDD